MIIIPKTGIDKLVFGMTQKDVENLYGAPDKQYIDDEDNIIYLYNNKKMRLTFYKEEGLKLGYIISSHSDLEFFSENVIRLKWDVVKNKAAENKIKTFERESFDSVDNYFNEDNWVIFQVEFQEVIRVELGAVINDKDEFEWKYKS